MKTLIVFLSLITVAAMATGCGMGSDVKFSPDPSIVLPQEENNAALDETPPLADNGGQEVNSDEENKEPPADEKTADCFVSDFCHKDCEEDSGCPPGLSCIMHVCTFDCQSSSECGVGGQCNEVGLCEAIAGVAATYCKQDAECGAERFCNATGACEKIPILLGCQKDVDCPSGQYCSELHECTFFIGANVSCQVDAECPSSYYCGEENQCDQECRTDFQCAEGKACAANGKCTQVGVPAKIVSFNFNALGADTDPEGPVSFSSENFRIDSAAITLAGRNEMLTSPRFKLTGSIQY